MGQAVDEGDDGCGVGEDVVPLGEGLVGGDEGWDLEIATADDLEEEVGVAMVVGEVAQLVDHQELGACVAAEAELEQMGAVPLGQVGQEGTGGGEQDGVAMEQ